MNKKKKKVPINTYRKKKINFNLNFLNFKFIPKNKNLYKILVLLILSLVFWVSYELLVNSSIFHLNNIEIRGQKRLSRDYIGKIAGVFPEQSIFKINTKKIKKKLESEFWISKADVFIKLPSILKIKITEEKALGIFNIKDKNFLVNEKGRLFKIANEEELKDLMTIKGFEIIDVDKNSIAPKYFKSISKIMRLSKRKDALIRFNDIKKIKIDAQMGIDMMINKDGNNLEIKLGFGHYKDKYEILKTLFLRLENLQEVCSIDVKSKKDKPITRYYNDSI